MPSDNDPIAVHGKDIQGVYLEKSGDSVTFKIDIHGNMDGIEHPLSSILPAIDARHEFVYTDFYDKGKFRYLDNQLEGPALFEMKADTPTPLQQNESLLYYLCRTVNHNNSNKTENGGIGKRLIEPGVGRTFLVDLLQLRDGIEYKDFSATGIGLTPYSVNGFVAVGRNPDGKVAVIRAEHRKNLADKLNAIGCRACKVVAIIEMEGEQVQMMDGTFSGRAIMIRAFRNVLRVKQIDPIAGFYHSLQHSARISSMIIEDMADFLGYNTNEPDYQQVNRLSHAAADLESFSAAADDFYKVVKPGTNGYSSRAQHYRQQIIKKYCTSIFDLARKRISSELGGALSVKDYLEWFATCLGKQMRLVKEHGFLHDYHHPGVSRYTPNWIYTLVEHNITLSAEFADLETGVFVHDPIADICYNLQIGKDDVLLLRKKFNAFHQTDYIKAKRVIQSLSYAAACGELIDEKHISGIISSFDHHYKYN
ncbi:protein adenylyltransferase SelO family protein [Chitinophaga pinensis]|nr:protein adenylyltransferase SelO family protein [Chitinophaga pinensis]